MHPPLLHDEAMTRARMSDLAATIERQRAPLRRYLRLLGADATEAEDLLQETSLRVWKLCQDSTRHALPAALLRKVARNAFLDHCRKSRRSRDVLAWTDAVDAWVADAPDALEDDRIHALRRCTQRLRGRARKAVELRHAGGLSWRELGEVLGMRVNGVKAILRRSYAVLRECVTEEGHNDTERRNEH